MRSPVVESVSNAYVGTELYALAEAKNYYRWVISRFAPFLGKRVIEIGAGIGTFSRSILTHTTVSELVMVEPGDNLIPLLQKHFAREPRVRIIHGYFQDLDPSASADSIVLVNVLEHVAEDSALLNDVYEVLTPGGTLLLLVPALSLLYGTLDVAFGHYRRYSKPSLAGKLQEAGFQILLLSYFNLPGILGWFLTGRVLRRRTLTPQHVRLYDRCVVPWLARLEGRWAPPLGQSLMAVARKVEPGMKSSLHGSSALQSCSEAWPDKRKE
jgi:ubiquinone/menaquinone biosynthesis C-methylase UbiE